MSIKVDKVTPSLVLGEGPHWDPETSTLYFIDFRGASIHSYKPDSGKFITASIKHGSVAPTFIIPVEGQNGKFVISDKNNVGVIDWDGVSPNIAEPKIIASCEPQENPTKLNDAKADPAGRLWTGTMGQEIQGKPGEFVQEKGGLYSISRLPGSGYKVTKHLSKISLSNGLTWSPDHKKFYHIDTLKHQVNSYDYDLKSGEISNPKVVLDFKEKNIPGLPDGMTTDSEGKLVVAVFGAGNVIRIDPESGEIITKISIPVPQVTSVVFGGKNLDELYVSTGNIYATPESVKMYPDAGSVYRVTNLGFKGLKPTKIQL